jgi:transcriptional regulator with XRE-family HTH domain
MTRNCGNIYKFSRKQAHLTQEQAAELLSISTRSLLEYEAGRVTPSDDVVCNMIEIYNLPQLAYMHLKLSTEIGRRFLPDISYSDLAQSVLKLQKEVGDLSKVSGEMIDIACDGIIEEDEKKRWGEVTKQINHVAGAALTLMFAR